MGKAFDRRVFESGHFDEFWADIKDSCQVELTQENEIKINGLPPNHFVEGIRKSNAEFRNKYFLRLDEESAELARVSKLRRR